MPVTPGGIPYATGTQLPTFDLPQGFYIDRAIVNVDQHGWRVYHDADECGADVFTSDYSVDVETVLAMISDHKCATVDPLKALDFATFAVSNHLDPDASTEGDVAELEANAGAVLGALHRLRDYVVASGEDLPRWVSGDEDPPDTEQRKAGDRAADLLMAEVRRMSGPTRPTPYAPRTVRQLPEERPLSDFAIHIGLIPHAHQTGPAFIWSDGDPVDGSMLDKTIRDVPGMYVDGDWEEWGERAENGTTALVYDFPANPWTDDFAALVSGLVDWVKAHLGAGRLSDVAYITEAEQHDTTVGSIYVGGEHPNLRVVNPRDWRTR